jgi:hypothetical protein
MPAVNGVGEPCAGKPHARFDAAGAGNGATWPRSLGWHNQPGNRRNMKAPGPTARTRHRASPRPYAQVCARQAAIAASSRSAARCTGICGENPIRCSRYDTPRSVYRT